MAGANDLKFDAQLRFYAVDEASDVKLLLLGFAKADHKTTPCKNGLSPGARFSKDHMTMLTF